MRKTSPSFNPTRAARVEKEKARIDFEIAILERVFTNINLVSAGMADSVFASLAKKVDSERNLEPSTQLASYVTHASTPTGVQTT